MNKNTLINLLIIIDSINSFTIITTITIIGEELQNDEFIKKIFFSKLNQATPMKLMPNYKMDILLVINNMGAVIVTVNFSIYQLSFLKIW